jgi:hypothetical protein
LAKTRKLLPLADQYEDSLAMPLGMAERDLQEAREFPAQALRRLSSTVEPNVTLGPGN